MVRLITTARRSAPQSVRAARPGGRQRRAGQRRSVGARL